MHEIYSQTLDKSEAWECFRCGMSNFSAMCLIDTRNRFDSLSIPDSPVPTDIGSLAATSSPVSVQHTRPKTVTKADLNHPLRILIMKN